MIGRIDRELSGLLAGGFPFHGDPEVAKKPDWLFRQSAVVPILERNGEAMVVLITSRSGRWGIPKGIIERELTPQASAANEAWAGTTGNEASDVAADRR